MDGKDLRKYMDSEEVKDIFGKIISGRSGYNTILEKTKPIPKCSCGKVLEGEEKFCPKCGEKVK